MKFIDYEKIIINISASNRMKELFLCFINQRLNTFSWGITLSEYLELKRILIEVDLE